MTRMLAIAILLLSIPLPLHADIYTYTDSQGIIHFTDSRPDKRDVPRYRVFKEDPVIYSRIDQGEIEEIIKAKSEKYGIEEELIKALIKTESDFRPHVVSKKGAVGLMQILPDTAQKMGLFNIEDPHMNIDAGCKILKMLLDKYNGDIELSLAAYNAGETAVHKYKGIPPYEETINYVQKVIWYYTSHYKKESDA